MAILTSLTIFPVREIIKTAFEHGINFIDVAEGYADGNSERELYAFSGLSCHSPLLTPLNLQRPRAEGAQHSSQRYRTFY